MARRPASAIATVVLGSLVIVALDQWTKWLVQTHIDNLPLTVIPGFFRIVYAENTGVAFGLLQGMGGALLLPSVIGCALVVFLMVQELRSGRQTPFLLLALTLILGGAIGNLIDRARYGYVVDFVDWYYGEYHWYTFNVADAAITVGVLLLVLGTLLAREPNEEEPAHADASDDPHGATHA